MKLPVILICAIAGIYILGDAVLAPAPAPEHPGYVDAVLASRVVMAAIRLAIVFAGGFVVLSVIGLVDQRRWLTKVGPVQVSEDVGVVDVGRKQSVSDLAQARAAIGKLRQELANSERTVNRLRRESD